AMLLLLGASGMFVLTLLESREGLTGRDLTAAAQLIDAPAAPFSAAAGAPPEAAPLPAVETIEPTGTAGYVAPPPPPGPRATPPGSGGGGCRRTPIPRAPPPRPR